MPARRRRGRAMPICRQGRPDPQKSPSKTSQEGLKKIRFFDFILN